MPAIRSKGGTLKRAEYRRRARAGEAGVIKIIDQTRIQKRLKSGQIDRSRNGMSVSMNVPLSAELAIQTDVRQLLELRRLALAEHYRASVRAGMRADGRGKLPGLSDRTLEKEKPRRGKTFGFASGKLADDWILGKITGSRFRARTTLKPNGADGRRFAINRWLRFNPPVDVQSVIGAANLVDQQAVAYYLELAVGATVGLSPQARTAGGVLSLMRR